MQSQQAKLEHSKQPNNDSTGDAREYAVLYIFKEDKTSNADVALDVSVLRSRSLSRSLVEWIVRGGR